MSSAARKQTDETESIQRFYDETSIQRDKYFIACLNDRYVYTCTGVLRVHIGRVVKFDHFCLTTPVTVPLYLVLMTLLTTGMSYVPGMTYRFGTYIRTSAGRPGLQVP